MVSSVLVVGAARYETGNVVVRHWIRGGPIIDMLSIEDVALLEILQRVDEQVVLTRADSVCRQIMFDSGLVTEGESGLQLTAAGILLCKSLGHRVAAAHEAEKILAGLKA